MEFFCSSCYATKVMAERNLKSKEGKQSEGQKLHYLNTIDVLLATTYARPLLSTAFPMNASGDTKDALHFSILTITLFLPPSLPPGS